ncbi:MAG TPA: cytochrome c, partial [Burkholderiales bacterium]
MAGAVLAGPPAHAESPSPPPAARDEQAVGRALYLEGRLPSGAALVGRRSGGLTVEGKQAACVNCHRRSGLGGGEGTSYIPPVTEEYLFAGKHSPPELAPLRSRRVDYTGETLARAIRGGLGSTGRALDFLMPRYELNDGEMTALIAYLRSLSTRPSPGAGTESLQFATAVAPGIAADRRQAMLDVLRACVDDRNAVRLPERGRMRLGAEIDFVPQRKWVLNLWELEGAPETWPAQLADHNGRKPTFALIAGLGAGDWGPVHAFCEQQGMPCLFPHVEAPSGREGDFYNLYWSRGVLL